MDYLPLFFNLRGMKVLVVGGGKVALRKIRTFSDAGALVTVIAPRIIPEISAIPGLEIKQKLAFVQDLDEPWSLVILATDNPALQADLAAACQKQGIFVNRCDSPQESTFITGAIVSKPPVLAGITSSGSPGISKMARRRFEESLEPAFLELGSLLNEIRPLVFKHFSTQPERENFFRTWTNEEAVSRVKNEGIAKVREEILSRLS